MIGLFRWADDELHAFRGFAFVIVVDLLVIGAIVALKAAL